MRTTPVLALLLLSVITASGAGRDSFGRKSDPLAAGEPQSPSIAPPPPPEIPGLSPGVPPTPPTPPAPKLIEAEGRAADLVRDYASSLVFVEGKGGQGSGFVVEGGGQRCLLTNQHVVAGNLGPRFTLLDQTSLQVGAAVAAKGHDIMRYDLKTPVKGLPVMAGVEKNVAIGDPVAVLGNAEGARVIKPFVGKVVGIGPNLVEVDAEFVPGNSGSPIIHVPSGKVIGIATYLIIRSADSLTGKTAPEKQVRRFGYRLDSVKEWQPVNWVVYNTEYQTLTRIEDLTQDFAKLLNSLAGGSVSPAEHPHPAIKRPIELFAQTVNRNGISAPDRERAVHDLLASLRSASQSDVQQASARLQYDFFIRQLSEEQQVRSQVYGIFDRVLKNRR